MKQIIGIAEVILWWMTRFILWSAVILGPILCAGAILGLAGVPTPGSFRISDITIVRQFDYLYAILSLGIPTTAGYLYVLRYRRTIEDRRDVRFILLSCLLVSQCIGFSFEARHFRTLVLEARPFDVRLSFVDADTGEPLRSLSARSPDSDTLPAAFFLSPWILSSGKGGASFRFRGVSVPSVVYDYTFSADGYEAQRVSVGTETESRVIEMTKKSSSKAIESVSK